MKSSLPLLLAGLLLAGCVSVPTGPGVMALPGAGKSLQQFRVDDAECRRHAYWQVGGAGANQAATDAGVRSAAVGTLLGAIVGAAIGGRDGAGAGAGIGLLMGGIAGADAARNAAYGSQRDYDNAYVQCMYARGEQVPVAFPRMRSRIPVPVEASATGGIDHPPPGYPPPPPGYSPPLPR